MAKHFLRLMLVFPLLSFFVGWSNNAADIEVSLNQEFSLSVGQSAMIKGEELQIRFLEMIGDSRCPKDVNCVWQGEVSCLTEITYSESLHRVVLTQPGLTQKSSTKTLNEYQISFRVEPYPEAGKSIRKEDYRLWLVIAKL